MAVTVTESAGNTISVSVSDGTTATFSTTTNSISVSPSSPATINVAAGASFTFTGSTSSTLPTGGLENQFLQKNSATDYHAKWSSYTLPAADGEERQVLSTDGLGTLSFGKAIAEHVHLLIRNDEGATIPAGTPIYSKGEIGNDERIKVGIADASDPAKMPAIGIAETTLAPTGDTKDGHGIITGVFNTNISGFLDLKEGDILYVSNSGGGLSQTKPTGTYLIQNVGIVLKTNGTTLQGLQVSCIGRTNDVPNIPNGQAWIGNASGVATPTTLADVATSGAYSDLSGTPTIPTGELVNDTTPQLGGDLDVNGQKIVSTSNGDIIIEANGTGRVGIGTDTPEAIFHVDGETIIGGEDEEGPVKLKILGTGDRGGSIRAVSDGLGSRGLVFSVEGDGSAASSGFSFIGNITPSSNLAYDLGASGLTWSTAYISHVTGRPNASQGALTLSAGTTSNPILFKRGATEEARIHTDGNFGIGTTSPTAKLHVKGDSSGSDKSALTVKNSSDTSLLLVRNDGNVGIGTTSPSGKLEVIGTLKSAYGLQNVSGTDDMSIYNLTNNTGYIRFINTTLGAQNEAMKILNNGNVGIGTGVPTQKLHVKGRLQMDRGTTTGDESKINLGVAGVLWGAYDGNSVALQKDQRVYQFLFNTETGEFQVHDTSDSINTKIDLQPFDSASSTKARVRINSSGRLAYIQHSAIGNNYGNVLTWSNGTSASGARGKVDVAGDIRVYDYSAGSGTGTERILLGDDGRAKILDSGNNTLIGSSWPSITSASNSVGIGYQALTALTTGSSNVAVGYEAGELLTTGGSNVLLGYQAGSQLTTESNKLYIDNSNTTTPLIYGEFDNNIVRVNGELQVGDPSSTGFKFPTTDGTASYVLQTNGSGTVSWAAMSAGASVLNDLTDVSAGSPTSGDVIVYNGANWATSASLQNLIEIVKEPTSDTATLEKDTSNKITIDKSVGAENITHTVAGTAALAITSTALRSYNYIAQDQSEVQFREASVNGTNHISLKAPANVATNVAFVLPNADGSADQVLKTNGSAALGWTTLPASGVDFDPVGTDNSTDVSINANASDVLRMNAGQILGAEDAAADKLVFWDDSESKLTYATLGTNLTMTGSTLDAADAAVTALNNQAANRLTTIGATTTELDGEANLTFDGTTLTVAGEMKAQQVYVNVRFTGTPSNGAFLDGARIGRGFFNTGSITAGSVYYLGSSAWALADADAASTGSGLLAVATDAGSAAEVLLEGAVKLSTNSGYSGAAKGDVLYLSLTAGEVTNDISGHTTGDIVRVLGYVLDASNNYIYFNPDNTWLEI